MRLIDADEVKKFLCKFISYDDDGEQYFGDVNSDTVYNGIDEIKPTYDVDKVVEQLEKCKAIMLSPTTIDCFGKECEHNDCLVCVFDKAISIVKKGGCESA